MTTQSKTWRDVLAADMKANPARSNIDGVLISRPHGGFRLAKQTAWGEEYVAFAYTAQEAWERLARVTGRAVHELKMLPATRVQ